MYNACMYMSNTCIIRIDCSVCSLDIGDEGMLHHSISLGESSNPTPFFSLVGI